MMYRISDEPLKKSKEEASARMFNWMDVFSLRKIS